MNRLEDRLRDAFDAAAGTVRPEAVGDLHERRRPARARRMAPLAAAAAVAIVVIGASVITPLALAGGHGVHSRPAGPGATSPAASASPSGAAVTTVPVVVGMTAHQATTVLQSAGLLVMIVSKASRAAVPPGTVIAQSPVGGARLISGATITLIVAGGPGPSPTPWRPPLR